MCARCNPRQQYHKRRLASVDGAKVVVRSSCLTWAASNLDLSVTLKKLAVPTIRGILFCSGLFKSGAEARILQTPQLGSGRASVIAPAPQLARDLDAVSLAEQSHFSFMLRITLYCGLYYIVVTPSVRPFVFRGGNLYGSHR